jgi:hypothetical protein
MGSRRLGCSGRRRNPLGIALMLVAYHGKRSLSLTRAD